MSRTGKFTDRKYNSYLWLGGGGAWKSVVILMGEGLLFDVMRMF